MVLEDAVALVCPPEDFEKISSYDSSSELANKRTGLVLLLRPWESFAICPDSNDSEPNTLLLSSSFKLSAVLFFFVVFLPVDMDGRLLLFADFFFRTVVEDFEVSAICVVLIAVLEVRFFGFFGSTEGGALVALASDIEARSPVPYKAFAPMLRGALRYRWHATGGFWGRAVICMCRK